ncbi:hypothetical protein BJ742DRAFT_907645 [Cladochytrium replicatum]|nr:hypothetical protein BJ742DRAFT_907645 [Cladochytrium replicatum]
MALQVHRMGGPRFSVRSHRSHQLASPSVQSHPRKRLKLLRSSSPTRSSTTTTPPQSAIQELNRQLFSNANAKWTNEAVAFHGYAGINPWCFVDSGLVEVGRKCILVQTILVRRCGYMNSAQLPPPLPTAISRCRSSAHRSRRRWLRVGVPPEPTGVLPHGNVEKSADQHNPAFLTYVFARLMLLDTSAEVIPSNRSHEMPFDSIILIKMTSTGFPPWSIHVPLFKPIPNKSSQASPRSHRPHLAQIRKSGRGPTKIPPPPTQASAVHLHHLSLPKICLPGLRAQTWCPAQYYKALQRLRRGALRLLLTDQLKDPKSYESYLSRNIFLPYVNNELEIKGDVYALRIAGVEHIVTVRFTNESTVTPGETASIGGIDEDQNLVQLRESDFCTDWTDTG